MRLVLEALAAEGADVRTMLQSPTGARRNSVNGQRTLIGPSSVSISLAQNARAVNTLLFMDSLFVRSLVQRLNSGPSGRRGSLTADEGLARVVRWLGQAV